MLFQTQSNVLFRLFRLLTAQVGSNLVIICTNSLDCYNIEKLSAVIGKIRGFSTILIPSNRPMRPLKWAFPKQKLASYRVQDF